MAKYEAIITMQNGDIIHYGVLGMKWGQHKYAKAHNGSVEGYRYHSSQGKLANSLYEQSLKKDKEKGLRRQSVQTAKRKFNRDKWNQMDKAMQNYGKKTSIPKAVLQSLLGRQPNSYAMNRALSQAAGVSTKRSKLRSLVGETNLLADIGSSAITYNEFNKSKGFTKADWKKRTTHRDRIVY